MLYVIIYTRFPVLLLGTVLVCVLQVLDIFTPDLTHKRVYFDSP